MANFAHMPRKIRLPPQSIESERKVLQNLLQLAKTTLAGYKTTAEATCAI